MAFMGKEGVDFEQQESDMNAPYVSLFSRFGSGRQINRAETFDTHRSPANNNNTPKNPAVAGSNRTVVVVEDSTVEVLSYFAIINSTLTFVALGLLLSLKQSTEATIIIFGLSLATFFRCGAVWQYYENTTFLKRVANVAFGSRFGWSERYDAKLLRKASVGVQFGFPLVLHTVSDIVQQGCTFYPLFVTITSGPDAIPDLEFTVIAFAFGSTVLAMFGTLLIRVSYGARLVELGLLLTYGTMFLAFILLSVTFTEFVEDKVYTRDIVFPWLKFLLITGSAFTKTAVEVRSRVYINLPAALTSVVFSVLMIDIIATVMILVDEDVFLDDGIDRLDEQVTVDQLIFANLAYDVYVIMFMAIQYMLVTRGDLN